MDLTDLFTPRHMQNSRGFDQWYGDRIRKCLSRHLYQEWKEDQTSWRQRMFLHSRKVKYYYELYLPTGFQVILPKNLARTLGYLNHRDLVPALDRTSSPTSVQLNKNQSVTLTATTTTIRRNDELVWGMLSKHSFQTMYVYSDLIESLVVGDVQANLLRMILPRGQPGEMVADEIKRPTYHRLRKSIFSSVDMN